MDAEVDPRVTKRKVTMTNYIALPPADDDPAQQPRVEKHEAIDYVRPDHLDAYLADARAKWQHVAVSETPDAGPGGYAGATAVPAHLELPDAGVTYPADVEA